MAELKIIRMSDIKSEPIEWLWEPYIPFGAISLIQGDGGDGKTTTALAIAAAVTASKALPGCGCTNPKPVIIQNAEDSYSMTIRSRLERFGADCNSIHVIDEEEQALSLSDDRIEQTIIRTGARLCILDPVQAYLGSANMNSVGGVRPLMKKLGTVAARSGGAKCVDCWAHRDRRKYAGCRSQQKQSCALWSVAGVRVRYRRGIYMARRVRRHH